jgi:hypothetical protein
VSVHQRSGCISRRHFDPANDALDLFNGQPIDRLGGKGNDATLSNNGGGWLMACSVASRTLTIQTLA